MNTLENNKLIAEFLSIRMHPCETIEKLKFLPMEERGLYNGYFIEDLKYHEDWNWLMRVVEKIENLSKEGETYMFSITKFSTRVTYKGSRIVDLPIDNTKIEAVYNACVEFIKWYNKQ